MTRQIGTKEIVINGQKVTVRVFSSNQPRERSTKINYGPNEDTLHALRMDSVYGSPRE